MFIEELIVLIVFSIVKEKCQIAKKIAFFLGPS